MNVMTQDLNSMLTAFADDAGQRVTLLFDSSAGFDLAAAFTELVGKMNGGDPVSSAFVLISPDPAVARRGGFSIPNEFVLSVFELDKLADRVAQLKSMYPDGLSTDLLQAWCVGAFRRYLFLDDDNHGQGEMDLSEVKAANLEKWRGEDGWPMKLLKRLGVEDTDRPNPSDELGGAFKKLFPMDMENVARGMKQMKAAIESTSPSQALP